MRRVEPLVQLAGPVVLLLLVGLVGSLLSAPRALEVTNALVSAAIVVGLYAFVGNSGVLSFGQIGFFIVGAYAAGEMTVPADVKRNVLPNVFSLIRDHTIGNAESLVLAAGIGGIYALLVGIPLMRLSGLAAGIATFAVLGITHNIVRNWEQIGPGPLTLSTVPGTTDLWQATMGAVAVAVIAFLYQRSRLGRQLRAAREDPAAAQAAGIDIHRQRLWAFTLSGALCGFAGGLYVHLGTINVEDIWIQLTFLTLAMLVVGGVRSLWGAVVGALLVSGLNSFLLDGENGSGWAHAILKWLDIGPSNPVPHSLWKGSALVGVSAAMLLILLVRPSGLTGGKEFRLPRPPKKLPRRAEAPTRPAPTP
jgi:branched-chain amino acid transport system permease protein